MKPNDDKNLERFVDKLMKDTSLESPSPEFTSKLMMQVQATEMDKAIVYKPLISKRAWFIIFTAIIALAGYFVFNTDISAGGWLADLKLDQVNNDLLKSLAVFKFSKITLCSVILLTVMLFAQITFIKNYFNKRFKA